MKHLNYLKKVLLPFVVAIAAFIPAMAAPLSGTYTVGGTSPNYATLVAAISDLTVNGVSGPVVLNIRSGTYSGTSWQANIPYIFGSSLTQTITIQAESGAGTVSITQAGTATINYVMKLDSAQYISIKNLTLINTSTTNGRVIELAKRASFVNITGNTLTSGVTTATTLTTPPMAIIYANNATGGNAFNGSSVNISSNTFNNGSIGVFLYGPTTNSADDIIDNNTINNTVYAYGIYTYYTNNLKVRGNNISKTGAGTWYGIYTNYSVGVHEIRNNIIAANTAVTATVYGIYGNYNTGTFGQRQGITNNNINFNTTGAAYALYWNYGNYDSICNNTIANITTTGVNYPFYNYNTSLTATAGNYMIMNNNTITASSTSSSAFTHYYLYYSKNSKCDNNNINVKAASGSISYYNGYYSDSSTADNNIVYDSTNSSITWYGFYANSSVPAGIGSVSNNNIRMVSTGSTITPYIGYYWNNLTENNNTIYVNSYGAISTCYWGYVCNNKKVTNSNVTFISQTSSMTIYGIYSASGGTQAKFCKNRMTLTAASGITNYNMYSAGFTNYDSNVININGGTGTSYHYAPYNGYNGNWTFIGNTIRVTSTSSGSIYGSYCYNGTSYTGVIVANNDISVSSAGGTTYGMLSYYMNKASIYNNLISSTNTAAGSNYTWVNYYAYGPVDIYNNTILNNCPGTGTNYTLQSYTYSSYPGKFKYRNNIFAKTSAGGFPPVWCYDGSTNQYNDFDYNNLYTPGTTLAQSNSPAATYATLKDWRTTGNDKNSLSYDPGFVNATTPPLDLHPDPTKPASWSVNGRGIHIPGNSVDITGVANSRVTAPAQGAPDLGAYEFIPTATAPLATAVNNATAGTTQVFTFGQDTVCTIDWSAGSPVPGVGNIYVKVYTTPPPATFTGFNGTFMYFYDSIGVTTPAAYNYAIRNYYHDNWLGTMAAEGYLHLAKNPSLNPGGWIGYVPATSVANTTRNFIYTNPTPGLNSFGYFTGMDIGDNAGLAKVIAAPTPIFCAGTYPVKIKVLNNGNNVLNSVKIDWNQDGGPFTPINYTTPINPNNGVPGSNEAIITLGNIVFANKAVVIKAYTYLPNGVADPFTADDTVTYRLHAGFQGVVTVDLLAGTGYDYVKLSDAITDLNIYGLCGPTTFNVRAGVYNDTNIYLTAIPGSSPVNTVTFQSENGINTSAVINFNPSTTASNYVVRMDGASYITFRNISILNAGSTANARCFEFLGNTRRDSIINCIVTSPYTTTSTNNAAIWASGAISADSCVFMNNVISGGYYGLYWYFGTSPSNTAKAFVCSNNQITNWSYYGTYIYNVPNFKFNSNTVTTSSASLSYNAMIYNYYCINSSDVPVPFECNNNKFITTGTSSIGLYLYAPNGYTSLTTPCPTRSTFMNNTCVGSASSYLTYFYYFSAVNMLNNTFVQNAAASYSVLLYFGSAFSGNNDVRNNVFHSPGNASTYTYYFYTSGSSGNVFDYNLYFYNKPGGSAAFYTPTTYATFAAYKTAVAASGWDQNSVFYAPAFLSNTDPRPDGTNPNSWALNGRAVQILGNNKDANGNPRVELRADGVPDIGAYEFEPSVAPPACTPVPTTAVPGGTQHFLFAGDTVASIKWNPTLLFTAPLTVRQYSGRVAPNFKTISPNRFMYFYTDIAPSNGTTFNYDQTITYKDIWLGTIKNENNMILSQKIGSFPWIFYGYGTSSGNPTTNKISAAGLSSFGANTGIDTPIVFSAIIYATGSTIICTGNSVTLQANAVSGYTYQWYKDGLPIAGAKNPTYSASQGGDYFVEITTPVPNVQVARSATISITVVAPPQAFVNASGPLTYCAGSNLNLIANTGTGLTYQWVQNGTDISGADKSNYKVGSAGIYTVKVSNIGCTTTSPATTVQPGPLKVNLGSDTALCERKNIAFTLDAGAPGAKYKWSTGDTTQQIAVFKGSGNYWVYVDAGPGCQASDSVKLNILPLPTISGISYSKTVLPAGGGFKYDFTVAGPKDVNGYLWLFYDAQGTLLGQSSLQIPPSQTFNQSMVTKLVMYNDCGTDTFGIVDWATGVNTTVKNQFGVEVYPNPATDRIRVSIEGANVYLNDISILNSIGEVVYRESVGGKTQVRDLNVSSYANGRYLIRANTTDGIITKPFNIIK